MPATKQPLPILVPPEQHIQIGAIVFPQMDQMDLTGPFAVLSRLPNSSFQLLWKNAKPVRDMHGLVLTPDATFADAKPIDLLVMTGGAGQEALMEDEEVLSFVSQQVRRAKCVFSICTGALVLGAAGRPGGDELLANFSVTEIFWRLADKSESGDRRKSCYRGWPDGGN